MKSLILLVTILAIASARFSLGTEAWKGFSKELGLTAEHTTGALTCISEIRANVEPLLSNGVQGAQATILKVIFESDEKHREFLASVIQRAQTELPQCKQFAVSLLSIFTNATLTDDEYFHLTNLIPYRAKKHAADIISLVIRTAEAIQEDRSRIVGRNLASIVRILTGLDHPETMADYVKNYEHNHNDIIEIETLEPERFLATLINTAAKTLSKFNAEIKEEQAKQLIDDVTAFFHVLSAARLRVSQLQGIEREVAILGGLRDLYRAGGVALNSIRNVVEVFVNLNGPQFNRQRIEYQVRRVVINYFKNLNELSKRGFDLGFESRHHHAASAGKALAGIIRALF